MEDAPVSATFAGPTHTSGGFSAQGSKFHAQGNINIGATGDKNKCLHALRLTDPRDDRRKILARKDDLLKDTCLWIRDDAAFSQWWNTDESQILWLHGDPGKGKTMIMIALADEISGRLKTKSSSVVSYFFCESTNSDNNTATSVLRGLIYMLVEVFPDLFQHVQKKYDVGGSFVFEDTLAIYSLSGLLSDMVNDPLVETAYLMIDALDECGTELMSLLELITREDLRLSRKIKWLVSSRNEPLIREQLESGDGRQHTSLELNSEHVSRAVTSFIGVKVRDLTSKKDYDQELSAFVHAYLEEHANDTFLWVALVCKQLSHTLLRKTKRAIEEFPSGLQPLYDRMMNRVETLEDKEDRDYCRQVLIAAAIARRPLELEELRFASELPETDFSNLKTVKDQVHLCGSFLTIKEDVVHFVHQSAKDYFDTGEGKRIFGTDKGSLHAKVYRRSLELMSGRLEQDMCKLRSPYTLIAQFEFSWVYQYLDGELRYACTDWSYHLSECNIDSTNCLKLVDQGELHLFLQRYLLYWLEIMSLLGEISEADLSLWRVERAIRGRKDASLLRASAVDAKRFLAAFRGIIEEAPLQIYSSALLLSPLQSVTRKTYGSLIPPWIDERSKVENLWGPTLRRVDGAYAQVDSVKSSRDGRADETAAVRRIWNTKLGAVLYALEGHPDVFTSVVFSPDSKLVASGSTDGRVKIWDAITGVVLYTLKDYLDSIASVEFSPDSKLVASRSTDGRVNIWDITTGVVLYTLEGYLDSIASVEFSPDSKLVASGSTDGRVKIYDATTGAVLYTLEGHLDSNSSIASVKFSPDCTLLVSESRDGRVKIWDATTGADLYTLKGTLKSVRMAGFPRDHPPLAAGYTYGRVKIWDTTKGAVVYTLEGDLGSITSVEFSRDCTLLASEYWGRTVTIWDTTTGAVVYTLEGQLVSVTSVDLPRDCKMVASESGDETLFLFDMKQGEVVDAIDATVDSREILDEASAQHSPKYGSNDCVAFDGHDQRAQSDSPFGIDRYNGWGQCNCVTYHGQKLLWLPNLFWSGIFAFGGNSVILVTDWGRMIWLRFEEDEMPEPVEIETGNRGRCTPPSW